MNLHDCDETGVQVVRLRFLGVENLHWVGPSWDGEDGSFIEILGELHGVQCRRRHNQLHVCAFLYRLRWTNTRSLFSVTETSTSSSQCMNTQAPPAYLLQQTKEDISVDCPLVSFIQHDNGVLAQFRVDQALSQQHTVCHVLDHGLRAGAVLKTDGVTHLEEKTVLLTLWRTN